MGIFDMFKKKETSFDEEIGAGEGLPKLDEMPEGDTGGFGAEKGPAEQGFGAPPGEARMPGMEEPVEHRPVEHISAPPAHAAPRDLTRDIELISAKLDTIKALVENMNHRMKLIEDAAYGESEKSPKRW